MKRKIFTLILCAATFTIVSAQLKELTIKVASKPVTLDGVIDGSDPWVETDWVNVDYAKVIDPVVSTMTAKFQLMYDAKNLYFAAKVNDADRFTGASSDHMNDCVEVFIAMDTLSPTGGTYKTGDFQIRMQAVGDPEEAGGKLTGSASISSLTFIPAVVDNGPDYAQEWVMTWDELTAGMDPAWEQAMFKFDIQVANSAAAGTRDQQMFWNSNSDTQWNNTYVFGLVHLTTPINLLPNSVNNVKANTAIYVSDNQLRGVKGLVSVYDVTGKLVLKSLAKEGTCSVATLKKGIYIVQSNNSASKISIR